MGPLATLLGFCAVAVLVYMLRWSGRVRARQSRLVAAPVADVRARVVDFRRWRDWNPWCEDDAAGGVTCSAVSDDVGSACSWSRPGDTVATIEHRRIDDRGLTQRMRFREPFPFRARGTWSFLPSGDGTLVTWSVRGRVAFPLRAFAATVQGALAFDLRYGLDRLAALFDGDGHPNLAPAYAGVLEMPALRYAYRVVEAGLDRVAQAVDEAAAEVAAELDRAGVASSGERLAVYLKTDARRRTTQCRAAVAVTVDACAELPVAEMPVHRAFVARVGAGGTSRELAWYLAMRRMRADGLEPDLALPPFERRVPGQAAHDDPCIELCIPVRPAVRRGP